MWCLVHRNAASEPFLSLADQPPAADEAVAPAALTPPASEAVPASPVPIAYYDDTMGSGMGAALMGNRVVLSDYFNVDVLDPAACLTQAPGAFNLLSPVDGAQSASCFVQLDWQDSPHALNYDIYLDTVNPPTARIAAAFLLHPLAL